MEMQQVRYFLALARELNFTRAAEACHVTQPALTRAIQALEAELGGRLFNRERQQTHLTELGRMMLPYIQSIQAQSDAATARARSVSKMRNVELKLCAMCTLSPTVLSNFIVAFQQGNRGVDLSVSDASASQLMRQLTGGEMEIGVMGHPDTVDDRFHALELYRERFVVVLPPEHRLAQQPVVRVSELNNEPYVNRVNCELADFAGEAFARQGVEVRVVFRSERDYWVLGMIKAGLGWGFFPEFYPFPDDVVVRPLVEPQFARKVSLMTVRGRPHSPAVGEGAPQLAA
jgi:DNA-binding transcriptional LysR family regulator